MKKTASLSTRTSLLLIAGIAIFSLTLIIILHIISNRLLYNWQQMETESMYEYVEKNLSSLITQSANQNKKITTDDISAVLTNFPYPPKRLVITDDNYEILYFYRESGTGRQMQNYMRQMQDTNLWRPIVDKEEKAVLFYSLKVHEFTEIESNNTLIKSFRIALIFASVASFILAFIASHFFSERIKKQTISLVAVLESIAAGNRNVIIPKSSIKEFSQIALAAQTLQENLLREETIRRKWSSDIAHDLRTPLTVLQGTMEGLLDGVFKADTQRLQVINTQVKYLSSLVNALSLLSKLETPDFVLHKETISLLDSLTNAVHFFSSQASLKQMNFLINVANEFIETDPVLFERLTYNLFSNAIEYGFANSDIEITVYKTEDEKKCLSVSNYAEVTDEIIERAFDRLYQGDSARTETHSGLGLSIVQAIVNAHGWSIDMQYDKNQKKVSFCVIFI